MEFGSFLQFAVRLDDEVVQLLVATDIPRGIVKAFRQREGLPWGVVVPGPVEVSVDIYPSPLTILAIVSLPILSVLNSRSSYFQSTHISRRLRGGVTDLVEYPFVGCPRLGLAEGWLRLWGTVLLLWGLWRQVLGKGLSLLVLWLGGRSPLERLLTGGDGLLLAEVLLLEFGGSWRKRSLLKIAGRCWTFQIWRRLALERNRKFAN